MRIYLTECKKSAKVLFVARFIKDRFRKEETIVNFELDTHTHTLASGHARNTIREMAATAAERGIRLLGITEHGPKSPGVCKEYYFNSLKMAGRNVCGVELLLGAELNILDASGRVDLPEQTLRELDLNIASLHTPCIAPGSRQENTQAYLCAMQNPYVDIIGHPDDGRYPVDYEAIVQAAKDCGVLLELNESSLRPDSSRKDAWDNDKEMLKLCIRYQVPIAIGSDAHCRDDVGNNSYALVLLRELRFPETLVLNGSAKRFKEHLRALRSRAE